MADPLSHVAPAPFQFASLPFSLLGRSAPPVLPPIGGYSDQDLERMRFALLQSGDDPARLARIQQVIAMRGMAAPAPPELLRPTPAKLRSVRQFGRNAVDARQQLLDALSTQPR